MISMPDNGVNAALAEWTTSQVDDFARLLVRLGLGTTRWLMVQILGTRSLADAGRAVNDPPALARFAAGALNEAGLLSDAVGRLRQEASQNAHVILGLDRIARNVPLDSPELQAIWNENEPFFNSRDFQRVLARGSRTVCAIGLDTPGYGIVGSGFLIGPDLVLTNHHAVEPFVDVHPDGSLTSKPGAGSIYCYFDYFAGPVPPVPPPEPPGSHPSIGVRCAPLWLVYGRPLLPYDGSDQSPNKVAYEYDYAVLRLSKPMGRLPARSSGGSLRGWLSLPQKIDTVGVHKRVIVFQHPNRAPQQLDVGTYEQMDRSNTRVWYCVNTTDGSSGGAAIDSDGQLFALHNAAVTVTGTNRLNQGIRIDLIKSDLNAKAPGCLTAPPDEDPLGFWSLSDNPKDPQPALGRMELRNHVAGMMEPGGKRVMVVSGPAGSGVRFTKRIVRRIVGAMPLVEFTPPSLATLTPADFVRTIVDEIGIVGHAAGTPPLAPNSTENAPQWLRLDLPLWLAKALGTGPSPAQARFPAWIIVNTITEAGERLLWANQLKDLVAALAGAHDAGQRAIDLPQLRWLFLARGVAPLPISGVDRLEEDLTQDTTAVEDFADCLAAAWRSVEKEDVPRSLLVRMGKAELADSPGSPPRESLARYVHDLMDDGAER